MALPAPKLDDRRFQDLVDDAKRMVMRRCPEWTDHNVSDPGVTLIETFAYMTDQLLYRLNRVPERLYIKFLDLIGVRILPPTPARVAVTFWLSAPAKATLLIPAGTRAATVRSETEEPIVFATVDDLTVVACSLSQIRTRTVDAEEFTDPSVPLRTGTPFPAFSPTPEPGDTLLLGLNEPAPHCTIRLDFSCRIDGVGVDPTHPPLQWEAWTGDGWSACEVSEDETGGLNRQGAVVLHLPGEHEAGIIDGRRAGWLRARVTETEDGQPPYSSPPLIHAVSAVTVGGTTEALHAEIVENEHLGLAEGVPGQQFTLSRTPVLLTTDAGPILKISTDDGWDEWQPVQTFAASGPDDRHYVLEAATGTVLFGPAIREPDGTVRQYGAVPARGAVVCMQLYSTGGGRKGNVAPSALQTLQSAIPFVARVENRRSAQGGADGESIEEAKARGPLVLRARSRAVTAEDYEAITREAAPEIARVRCLTAGEHDVDAGSVKVLVVPTASNDQSRIRFEDLVPPGEAMRRIADRLNEVRLIGARVLVEPPRYQGLTVVARIVARRAADPVKVRKDALDQLYRFFNPLTGGHDGKGWPFGRDVQTGEVFGVLQQVHGVDFVEDVRLFGANPVTGERGAETNRLVLDPHSLVYSYEHHLRVEESS